MDVRTINVYYKDEHGIDRYILVDRDNAKVMVSNEIGGNLSFSLIMLITDVMGICLPGWRDTWKESK